MSLAGSSAYERKSSVDAQSENGDISMSPFIMGARAGWDLRSFAHDPELAALLDCYLAAFDRNPLLRMHATFVEFARLFRETRCLLVRQNSASFVRHDAPPYFTSNAIIASQRLS